MRLKSKKQYITAAIAVFTVLCLILGVLILGGKEINLKEGDLTSLKPEDYTAEKKTGAELSADASEFVAVAQNENYILSVNVAEKLFSIASAKSESQWLSGKPTPEGERVIPRNINIMQSALNISFLPDEKSTETETVNSRSSDVSVVCKEIQDGFEFCYEFEEGISVKMQICLDETGFYALIPEDGITESTDARLVSIDILPSFGSRYAQEDAYFVYPDGNGALYYCDTANLNGTTYSASVYGTKDWNLDTDAELQENGTKNIICPYFGSTDGNTAMLGYIVSGAETSRIVFSQGNQILSLNRLYASRDYRQMLLQKTEQGEQEVYEKERNSDSWCVKYILLEGKSADYSGMASSLRELMKEIKVLPESGAKTAQTGMMLDILLATQKESIIGNSETTLTSFNEAENILKSLEKAGISAYNANLLGWQKGGYSVYPKTNKPSAHLGSKGDLKSLLSLDNGETVHIMLQTDYLYAATGGNFSKQRDIVYSFKSQAASDGEKELFLLNPFIQLTELISDLKSYSKLGAKSVAFDSLSNRLAADYSKNRRVSYSQAAEAYASMIMHSKNNGNYTAVQGGSAYLLYNADMIYDLYDDDSNTLIFDKEIPFLQLVLHGVLPYSCETPGNMASDFEALKLKWIEYGSMPYFLVTEAASNAFEDTQIKDVFSSSFAEWQDIIVDCYKEFNSESLNKLSKETIISHEYISDDTVKVVYESGDMILINYGNAEIEIYGTKIAAKSYSVVTAEGAATNESR